MYIYSHWQALCTITRFCAHWQTLVSTDRLLCPLTRFCAHWQTLVPIDTPLCPLTAPCAHWQILVPTDTPLCPLTAPCAHWQILVPTDRPVCPLTGLVPINTPLCPPPRNVAAASPLCTLRCHQPSRYSKILKNDDHTSRKCQNLCFLKIHSLARSTFSKMMQIPRFSHFWLSEGKGYFRAGGLLTTIW